MTVKKRTITSGAFSILMWLGLAVSPTGWANPPDARAAAAKIDPSDKLVPRLIPSEVADSPLGEIPVLAPTDTTTPVVVHDITIDEAALTPPTDWAQEQEKVLRRMAPIIEQLDAEVALARATLTEEQFETAVEKNELTVKIPGVGKAQLNRVKGSADDDDETKSFFVRAVDYETTKALIYVDKNTVSPDSRHFKRIIARQHLCSGLVDARDKKSGRDVVLIWQDGPDFLEAPIHHVEYVPRHLPGSGGWWKDFWAHLYSGKRSESDKFMAVWGVVTQVGLLTTSNFIKMKLGWADSFEYSPLVISALFGGVLGLYSDVYKGLTTEGSAASRAAKMSLVSFLHTYSYSFFKDGVWNVIRIWDRQGMIINLNNWMNIVLGKMGRVAWAELPKIQEWQRQNPRPINFSLGVPQKIRNLIPENSLTDKIANYIPIELRALWNWKGEVKVNRAVFRSQNWYLVPFTLSWLGRAGLSATGLTKRAPTGSTQVEVKIDAGDITLLSSIPLANAFVWAYSKWLKFPDEPRMRKRMLDSMKLLMLYPIPGAIYRFVRDYSKEVYQEVLPMMRRTATDVVIPALSDRCRRALTRLRNDDRTLGSR